MTWIRILAGGLFLAWFGAVLYAGWRATRPWKPEGKTKWGEVHPDTVRAIEDARRSGGYRRV